MKTSKKEADAHIAARMKEKVSRPSTASVDRDAARAVANVEAEWRTFNAKRVADSNSIAANIFSKDPKKGR